MGFPTEISLHYKYLLRKLFLLKSLSHWLEQPSG